MLQHEKHNREPVGDHVQRAIDAARMTKAQLMQKYPCVTENGFLRPTDTGSLYRRIGLVLLKLPPELFDKLISEQSNIGLSKLRVLAKKKRSLQENISKVRLILIAVKAAKAAAKVKRKAINSI